MNHVLTVSCAYVAEVHLNSEAFQVNKLKKVQDDELSTIFPKNLSLLSV